MTREEAKEILEEVKVLDDSMYQYNPAYLEALEMAIEALKDNQWQKGYDTATANANETKRSLVEMYEQQIEALKADPCEDAVSRKAVMKLKSHKPEYGDMIYAFDVELLPPVTPKQRTGKWIRQGNDYTDYYECENCGIAIGLDDIKNFCPNCGAKMEGE